MGNHANWRDLAGRQVEVRKEGQIIRTGYVVDVAFSTDILWLEADGVNQRALFEKAMGYTICPSPTSPGASHEHIAKRA